MKVAVLYPPGSGAKLHDAHHDALVNWVATVARHCHRHDVLLVDRPQAAVAWRSDCVLALTSGRYSPDRMDADLGDLRGYGMPTGVLHNEDWGVPAMSPFYASFVWTYTSYERVYPFYQPLHLVPQPFLPRLQEPKERPLLLGTFGHTEPKKHTLALARWARLNRVRMACLCPDTLAVEYAWYIERVRREGVSVTVHSWQERVEDLASLMDRIGISHLIFVVTPTKGGTGGCATSPHYATAFGRPVVVIDDEPDLWDGGAGGVFQVDTLARLDRGVLGDLIEANPSCLPDDYFDQVGEAILENHHAQSR